MQKKIIPTLIVATYILFNIISNIINTNHRSETESFKEAVTQVAFIFYKIGWLFDPLIYILL